MQGISDVAVGAFECALQALELYICGLGGFDVRSESPSNGEICYVSPWFSVAGVGAYPGV